MSKVMDELRATLMRTKQFDWWQRRQLQWLSPKNEEQRQVVMTALGANHSLMPRMIRCGQISASNNIFYCAVPLCPRCFMRERGKQTRQAIRETFTDAKNEDLAFATILLPARTDIGDVHDVIEKEKRRLRNFVERQRGLDGRWYDFQLVGFWEMGRMTFGEFQNAGRKTKLALNSLEFPFIGADEETVWLPHLHAVIKKGRLTELEIAKALRNDGRSAPYQVDVRPFHTYKSVEKNLQNLTRYSLKFRIENDPQQLDPFEFIAADKDALQTRAWWPAEDIKAYAEWLRVERSGFQSLRFVLGNQDSVTKPKIASELADLQGCEVTENSSRRSLSHLSDGSVSEIKEVELKARGICDVDFDALIDVDGRVGHVSDVVRYNNILLDTNWIDGTNLTQSSPCAADPGIVAYDADTAGKVSRHAGKVISLSERLRSINLANRANGDQRSGTAH